MSGFVITLFLTSTTHAPVFLRRTAIPQTQAEKSVSRMIIPVILIKGVEMKYCMTRQSTPVVVGGWLPRPDSASEG
jgi:hypothetical protein